MDNIALAKKAYSGFEAHRARRAANTAARRERGDYQPYFDLLAEDVVLTVNMPAGTPIGGQVRGKPAVTEFSTVTIPQLLEDIRLEGPLEFIGNRDRIVILGRESYTIKKSGVPVRNKAFAVALDFRDGRIIRELQIKEMSEFVDACRSG